MSITSQNNLIAVKISTSSKTSLQNLTVRKKTFSLAFLCNFTEV